MGVEAVVVAPVVQEDDKGDVEKEEDGRDSIEMTLSVFGLTCADALETEMDLDFALTETFLFLLPICFCFGMSHGPSSSPTGLAG